MTRSMYRDGYQSTYKQSSSTSNQLSEIERLAVVENEIVHLWHREDRNREQYREDLKETRREQQKQNEKLSEVWEYFERRKRLLAFLGRHWRWLLKTVGGCLLFAATMLNLVDVNHAATIYRKGLEFVEKLHPDNPETKRDE